MEIPLIIMAAILEEGDVYSTPTSTPHSLLGSTLNKSHDFGEKIQKIK